MKINFMSKWLLLPLSGAIAWFALQGFGGAAVAKTVSYTSKATSSVILLNAKDSSKLSFNDKLSCMSSVRETQCVANYNDVGEFDVIITALNTTWGGKKPSLEPLKTTIINRNGTSYDGGRTYIKYDQGEYQNLVNLAKDFSTMTNECANAVADAKAYANSLVQSGATVRQVGGAHVFTLNNVETWLDLNNGLVLGEATRSNDGKLLSDIYYVYSGGGDGRSGEGCSVISKVVSREMDVISNAPVIRQIVYDISNFRVTDTRK
jgi:hypothetical protein